MSEEKTTIEYRPIGTIHSPFTKPKDMPIQPSRGRDITGTIIVDAQYAAGLQDLDGFSHIILLYHLHRAKPHRLRVIPFLDDQLRGVFATRAPSRPNPIGLSVVRLTGVKGNVLSICDLDIIDGTPVLDIKPYFPEFDAGEDIRTGWLETASRHRRRADDRFSVDD